MKSKKSSIFYSYDRSPALVLHLHNLTFLQAALIDCFSKTKSITSRKMFGQYYHAIVCHSAQQYRVFSLPSSNAEDEERMFNLFKTMSKLTSNHHPDNVLANAFVRLQEENCHQNKILWFQLASSTLTHLLGKHTANESLIF